MAITASSDVRTVTISDLGVTQILAPTPMSAVATDVWAQALAYGIDPNLFLGYTRAEDGFLQPGTIAAQGLNPLDLICAGPTSPTHFATSCAIYPGNSLYFDVFADLPTGVKGGYDWLAAFAPQAGYQWGPLLNLALCGQTSCADPSFVTNVLSFANQNAAAYPPSTLCPDGYVADPTSGLCVLAATPVGVTPATVGLGLVALALAGYLAWEVH